MSTGIVEIPIHGGGVALVDAVPAILAVVRGRTWHRDGRGYLVASVRGKTVKMHREVWLAAHGSLPGQLDHRSRCRDDNRLDNLRASSASLNLRNRGKWQGNLPAGVERASECTYRARVSICDEMVSLGTFGSIEAAEAAYRLAADRLLAIEADRSARGLPFASDEMPPPANTPERKAWAAMWRDRLTAPEPVTVVSIRPGESVTVIEG